MDKLLLSCSCKKFHSLHKINSQFCHFSTPHLNTISSFLTLLIQHSLKSAFSSPYPNKWKHTLMTSFSLKAKLSFWLSAPWITRIWRHLSFSYSSNFSLSSANHVYILFNSLSKKVYIGETSILLYKRLQKHYKDSKTILLRKLYKYMKKVPFSLWFMLPLQSTPPKDKQARLQAEHLWMHRFRTTLLNDPFSWIIPSKYLKPKHPKHQSRLQFINKDKAKRKSEVLNFFEQKKKSKFSLISLLSTYHAAFISHAPTTTKRQIFYYIQKYEYQHKNLIRSFFISLPSNILYNKKFTRNYIKTLLFKYLDKDIAFFVFKRLKISFFPTSTLKSLIHNSKSYHNKINLLESNNSAFPCPCSKFPNLLLASKHNSHILLKAQNIPFSHANLRSLLLLNSKNPILNNPTAHYNSLKNSLKKFFNNFHITLSQKELNKFYDFNYQFHARRTKPLLSSYVKNCLTPYKSLIFNEIDKNTNSWIVLCPKLYNEMHHDHFLNNSKVYSLPKISNSKLKLFILNKASFFKINSIAPLKTLFKFNLGKVINKNKDLFRVRPIVSFFFNVAKSAGKRVSRALNVAIKALLKIWVTMEMTQTSDYPKIIKKLNSSPIWNTAISNRSITFLQLDIKEQFTSLPKNLIISILNLALNAIFTKFKSKHIYISKKKFLKSKDCILNLSKYPNKTRSTDRFHKISFTQILNYVNFELETSYFFVGSTLIHQQNGLPMGAFTSAALADIFSMYREHTNLNLWKNLPFLSKSFRFRDDIIMLFTCTLNKPQIKQIHQNLQTLYGPNLTIKLENSNYLSCKFIDTSTHLHKNKFIILDKNVNYPFNDNFTKISIQNKKCRFPDPTAEWPNSLYISIIYSTFFRIHHTTNSNFAFLLSLVPLCLEFLSKGYRKCWIRHAINKLNPNCKKSALRILSLLTLNLQLFSTSSYPFYSYHLHH